MQLMDGPKLTTRYECLLCPWHFDEEHEGVKPQDYAGANSIDDVVHNARTREIAVVEAVLVKHYDEAHPGFLVSSQPAGTVAP